MPIYEFRCESCQEVFEHLALSQGEAQELRCPACGGQSLSRVLSACATVMGDGGGGATASPAAPVQNRSCGKGNSCTTITLPGHSR